MHYLAVVGELATVAVVVIGLGIIPLWRVWQDNAPACKTTPSEGKKQTSNESRSSRGDEIKPQQPADAAKTSAADCPV